MHVRFAEASDEGRLFELVREFPAQSVPDAATFAILLKAKLEDSASYIALATEGERVVGYVAGYRHRTFYASGETAWVDELFVDSRYRGQGAGRLLMKAFELWARGHGCRLVGLATRGAREFYQRLGYGSTAGYYKKYLNDA